MRAGVIWGGVTIVVAAPLVAAAASPLLAWRDPVYIVAGFAGIVALAMLLLQPLWVAGYLPGFRGNRGRHVHRWFGAGLIAAIVLHVAGLWITSPPDMVDALMFRSPTAFSAWGVVAMWAAFAAALLGAVRRRFRRHLPVWRLAHTGLVLVVVVTSVVHAALIEGTMEPWTKALMSGLAVAVFAKVAFDLRAWAVLARRLS